MFSCICNVIRHCMSMSRYICDECHIDNLIHTFYHISWTIIFHAYNLQNKHSVQCQYINTHISTFVKAMYRGFDSTPAIDFPHRSIWNSAVPPKFGFFTWEATWGKVLTLDNLKRRGMTFANRCFLCEEDEETINHLLVHCRSAKMLWDLLLSIGGINWVFPSSVLQTLLAWQGIAVGKKRKKIWTAAPLCLFWTIWRARNKLAFENKITSAQRIKFSFISNLWSWANLFGNAITNSVLEFLTWLGCR